MAVRIKLIRTSGPLPAVRAHAAVSLAAGVWLSGIQVVEGEAGLAVRFPATVMMDATGAPSVHESLEFEREETRAKWEQRILEAYRAEAAPPPPPAKPPPPLARVAAAGPETVVHTAGAAQGNPGPGAAAALIEVPGRPAIELMRALETTTPSGAAHEAVLLGLRELERLRASGVAIRAVRVRGDGPVALKHLQGTWEVTEPALQELAQACRDVVAAGGFKVVWEHVRSDDNQAAIALVQRCLDAGG